MNLLYQTCKQIATLIMVPMFLYQGGAAYDKRYACYEHFGYDVLVIEPRNTIYQKVNETVTVFCSANPIYNVSSSELYFTRGLSQSAAYEPHEILNENTIRVNISEANASKYQLSCQDSRSDKCVRDIVFGYPPLNVENFGCVSFSWRTLECSYDLPQNAAQRTQDDYFLSYSLRGKSIFGFKCKSNHEPCCSIGGKECWRWDNSDNFLYDVAQQYLNFTVSSTNPLGTRFYNYVVNQYEIMIPDPVRELDIKDEGAFEVRLSGRLPTFLNLFPPGIIYRIKTQVCQYEEEILGKIHGRKMFTKRIDAQWPGQTYKISVSLRSGNNSWVEDTEEDEWWSKSVSRTIWIPSQPPTHAPGTTAGGFHILNWESSSTTVILFWEDLDECLKGGKEFKYRIDVDVMKERTETQPTEVTDTYALFENFVIVQDKDYTFSITPVNEAGQGEETATVVIAREHAIPEGVFFPVLIFHPEEDILQFRWFTSETEVKFTLFWCSVEDNFQSQSKVLCESMRWKHVSNETETTLTKRELHLREAVALQNLRFGVSTQKESGGAVSSSGIVWSSCLLGKYENEGSKLTPSAAVLTRTESTVLVVWEFDCEMWRSFPLSIEVFWCEGEHNITSQCTVNLEIQNINFGSIEIKNLKSNQNFTLWIRVNFVTWKSEYSSALHFATTNQIYLAGSIVLNVALAVVAMVTILAIAIYSPQKVMEIWRTAKQKLNLPPGIDPEDHFDSKNSLLLSNDTFCNFANIEKVRSMLTEEFSSMQPLLSSEENASKTSTVLESQCTMSENSEVQNQQNADENKSTTNTNPNDSENPNNYQLSRNSFLKCNKESTDYFHISRESTVAVNNFPSAGYVAAFSPNLFHSISNCGLDLSKQNLDKRNDYITHNDLNSAVLNNSDKKISPSILPLEITSKFSSYVQAVSPLSYDDNFIRIKDIQSEKYLTIHSLDDLNIVFNNDVNKSMRNIYSSSTNLTLNERENGRPHSVIQNDSSLSPLPKGYILAVPMRHQASYGCNLVVKNNDQNEENQSNGVLYDINARNEESRPNSFSDNNSIFTNFYSHSQSGSTALVHQTLSQKFFIGPTDNETFTTVNTIPLEYVTYNTYCDAGNYTQETDFRVAFSKEGTTFGKVTVRNIDTKQVTEFQESDWMKTPHIYGEEAKSLPTGLEEDATKEEGQMASQDNKYFASQVQRSKDIIFSNTS